MKNSTVRAASIAVLAVLIVVGVILRLTIASPSPTRPKATLAAPPRWMIAAGALKLIDTNPTVKAALDRPSTLVIVKSSVAEVPAGWNVTPVQTFDDYASLKAGIGAGLPGIKGVVYDIESWPFTPLAEQQAPGQYTAMAATAAHAAGLFLISAPAQDLLPGGGNTRFASFLPILRSVAMAADYVDLQVQSSMANTSQYVSWVGQASVAIKAAHYATSVIAGLSTNPPGAVVTKAELLNAVQQTHGLVSGYWLNVPGPGPQCPSCNPQRLDLAIALLSAIG